MPFVVARGFGFSSKKPDAVAALFSALANAACLTASAVFVSNTSCSILAFASFLDLPVFFFPFFLVTLGFGFGMLV